MRQRRAQRILLLGVQEFAQASRARYAGREIPERREDFFVARRRKLKMT